MIQVETQQILGHQSSMSTNSAQSVSYILSKLTDSKDFKQYLLMICQLNKQFDECTEIVALQRGWDYLCKFWQLEGFYPIYEVIEDLAKRRSLDFSINNIIEAIFARSLSERSHLTNFRNYKTFYSLLSSVEAYNLAAENFTSSPFEKRIAGFRGNFSNLTSTNIDNSLRIEKIIYLLLQEDDTAKLTDLLIGLVLNSDLEYLKQTSMASLDKLRVKQISLHAAKKVTDMQARILSDKLDELIKNNTQLDTGSNHSLCYANEAFFKDEFVYFFPGSTGQLNLPADKLLELVNKELARLTQELKVLDQSFLKYSANQYRGLALKVSVLEPADLKVDANLRHRGVMTISSLEFEKIFHKSEADLLELLLDEAVSKKMVHSPAVDKYYSMALNTYKSSKKEQRIGGVVENLCLIIEAEIERKLNKDEYNYLLSLLMQSKQKNTFKTIIENVLTKNKLKYIPGTSSLVTTLPMFSNDDEPSIDSISKNIFKELAKAADHLKTESPKQRSVMRHYLKSRLELNRLLKLITRARSQVKTTEIKQYLMNFAEKNYKNSNHTLNYLNQRVNKAATELLPTDQDPFIKQILIRLFEKKDDFASFEQIVSFIRDKADQHKSYLENVLGASNIKAPEDKIEMISWLKRVKTKFSTLKAKHEKNISNLPILDSDTSRFTPVEFRELKAIENLTFDLASEPKNLVKACLPFLKSYRKDSGTFGMKNFNKYVDLIKNDQEYFNQKFETEANTRFFAFSITNIKVLKSTLPENYFNILIKEFADIARVFYKSAGFAKYASSDIGLPLHRGNCQFVLPIPTYYKIRDKGKMVTKIVDEEYMNYLTDQLINCLQKSLYNLNQVNICDFYHYQGLPLTNIGVNEQLNFKFAALSDQSLDIKGLSFVYTYQDLTKDEATSEFIASLMRKLSYQVTGNLKSLIKV